MTISGETIDYGPCAFIDKYDPETVFSSIDKMGRYAYCNQPRITKWNLSRFAECLIPLIHHDQNQAIKSASELINTFEKKYEERWMNMMRNKLGLQGAEDKDKFLIVDLLTWMHLNKVDYTNTFCYLMNEKIKDDKVYESEDFQNWKKRWEVRLKINNNSPEKYLKLMKTFNPLIIPRNHKVEEALEAAKKDNIKPVKHLLEILKKPYTRQNNTINYQVPTDLDEKYQTFCGT